MTEDQDKIDQLEQRLDDLVRTQISFQQEISLIRGEIIRLKAGRTKSSAESAELSYYFPVASRQQKVGNEVPAAEIKPQPIPETPKPAPEPPPVWNRSFGADNEPTDAGNVVSDRIAAQMENARSNLEKFIGENLISKIGIIVLILGIGIGAKYAIDNNLISQLTRIIVAYTFGLGLIGLAVRLKPKYLNFSAVLLSGGMASMYFVTYFAYSSYSLISQATAFVLMAMFTLFTVASALIYDRQVIAHIGLVGAYAVPFLLSNNSGNYAFLFTYIAIINSGILAVSIKRSWNSIFYTSSAFTWLIFAGWLATKYSPESHIYLALTFLGIYFGTFYGTRIAHGLIYPDDRVNENIGSAFATVFVFYVFCFAISNENTTAERYALLFSYLAVFSLAILLVSYRYYGRFLIYISYPFTWLIYGAWFQNHYDPQQHIYLAAAFAAVFFAIYYVTTLICRSRDPELSLYESTGLFLTNSFIFYGFGYAIMDGREFLDRYFGLFTAAHAGLHFGVLQAARRFMPSAEDVKHVLTVLALTFATIAVPVQFDGNRITMIWAVEAALLFWYARAKQIRTFEYFSFPVIALASAGIFVNWVNAVTERTPYPSEFNRQPLANGDFVTALVFIACFGLIFLTNRHEKWPSPISREVVAPLSWMVGGIGVLVLYNTFRIEIDNYFHIQTVLTRVVPESGELSHYGGLANPDLGRFNFVWQLNYSIFFVIALVVLNLQKFRSKPIQYICIAAAAFCLLAFSTAAMVTFFELRESYMARESSLFAVGFMNIAIRYVSYLFVAGLIYLLYESSCDELLVEDLAEEHLELGFDAVAYVTVLILASCELVNLMKQFQLPDSSKLGLSVLWGVYALGLIVVGIYWSKKHLRIAAFVLLALTLAKLFVYDVSNLGTIPKTILFVSLGILLLIVSFLYNKYKDVIFKPIAIEHD